MSYTAPSMSLERRGILLILLSALFFALATVFAKLMVENYDASALIVTFCRFAIGLLVALPGVITGTTPLKPVNPRLVAWRAITNTVAVFLFFLGVQFTTVTKANLLNMTYPVFVFLAAPLINRESSPKRYYIFLLLTLFGAWQVVRPEELERLGSFVLGDLLAFSSAVVAGLAISVLRQARKQDESSTILFYLMLLGTVANTAALFWIPFPPLPGVLLAAVGGAMGAAGQLALTAGYRYVSAAGGALLSSSRLLFAILLGAIIFGDLVTLRVALGALLIACSLIGVTLSRLRAAPEAEG
ncbi:MAG: DMT family transporter [Alkalispirochaetaceae bacterium]